MTKLLLAACALAAATPATAAVTILQGDTTNGMTYNRVEPVTNNLSTYATDVHFQAVAFTVDTDSGYTTEVLSDTPGYNPFLSLYIDSFDPADPQRNILASDDDHDTTYDSDVGWTLHTGITYIAVATGSSNDDLGQFTMTIDGLGNATITDPGAGAVPEPATWAMMVAGFGFVGGALRARPRRTAESA